MSTADDRPHKPTPHQRTSMTRKGDGEESEAESKPTLRRRSQSAGTPSRQQRIVEALDKLSEDKLRQLTTKLGADELAVALLDADDAVKQRVAGCLAGEQLKLFHQYMAMGKDKLPSSVVDGVQGKLMRLAMMA